MFECIHAKMKKYINSITSMNQDKKTHKPKTTWISSIYMTIKNKLEIFIIQYDMFKTSCAYLHV